MKSSHLLSGLPGYQDQGKHRQQKIVAEELKKIGLKHEHLDGETIRELLPKTGFSKHEVDEHIKRVGLLASRLENVGVFVVASFIFPYQESRDFVRKICKNYVEVYLSTPVEVCASREKNNLFRRARAGEIKNFPGVDVLYEAPKQPDLNIDTTHKTIHESADQIMRYLKKYL
ncbi:adenylyl-sulfate kinase [candidate division KSB1 bacterium]|nr:adenylyl-sulfate kinase [candidate division KSB1 bacterium]MBL7095892.1 adenylyl-sulfate kinase [candidate division KSB1 bacterium]